MKALVLNAGDYEQYLMAAQLVERGHQVVAVDEKPWQAWHALIPGAIGLDCTNMTDPVQKQQVLMDCGPFDVVLK